MPTRIISWQQLVLENDPNWIRNSLNPLVWEFSNGRWFVDPTAPYAPLPGSGLLSDGGFLILDGDTSWPTTPNGLGPGHLFSNGGFVCSVPGAVHQPGATPLIFPGCTSSQLLLFGAAPMPQTAPSVGSGIVWLNSGFVCIA